MAPASTDLAFATFETALGSCAIVWSPRGIRRFVLPEPSPAQAFARVAELGPVAATTPPNEIQRAIDDIVIFLAGGGPLNVELQLDLSDVTPFRRAVYQALCNVPPGTTVSYGELAARAGSPNAARAVGGAMHTNPIPLLVPCHRVLGANGSAVGFSAYGGVATKAALLALEGVTLDVGTAQALLPFAAGLASPE